MTEAQKLEPTQAHEEFMLDKKEMDDPTIGDTNDNLFCPFSGTHILGAGDATKVYLDVDMIQNT